MTVAKKSSAQTVQRKRLADRTTPTTADCMYVSVRGIARRAASLFMAGDERRCGMRRAGRLRGHFSVTLGKRFSKNRRFVAAWLVRVFRDMRQGGVFCGGRIDVQAVNRFLQGV